MLAGREIAAGMGLPIVHHHVVQAERCAIQSASMARVPPKAGPPSIADQCKYPTS